MVENVKRGVDRTNPKEMTRRVNAIATRGQRILQAWGLGVGDLGSYSACASIRPANLVHYCWMGHDITTSVGVCVPKSCSEEVLVRNARLVVSVVEHITYNQTKDIWQAGCTTIEAFDTGEESITQVNTSSVK